MAQVTISGDLQKLKNLLEYQRLFMRKNGLTFSDITDKKEPVDINTGIYKKQSRKKKTK